MRQRWIITITDSLCLGHRDESEVPPLPLLLGYALADDGELFVKERKERVRRRVKVIDAVLGTVLAFSQGEPPPLSLELLLPKYLKLRHCGLP